MNLNDHEFRDKVLACWLGKNIGGTLGAPMEWRRQVNHVTFYTQDLEGEPAPNDDLDVQLLWLIALEEKGIEITAHTLAEYWTLYLTPHWSEYGIAKINMRSGLVPPFSGTLFNEYKDSCGCFLRSEIWACLTPGNPRLAARYAYQDGIIDHGNGEGTLAEVFCAALESAAFVLQDIPTLIDIALSYIPGDCGVAGAVRTAVDCYQTGKTWREARDTILEKYRGKMFFGIREMISDEDFKRGFGEGQRGWDVPSNIGMLMIGLLYGEGDFSNSVCTAVNCGEDTDCTGATLGSLFGILHGTAGIPEKWIAPIGKNIKTACLNLGELGYYGNQLPVDVDDLTDRTIRLARRVIDRFGSTIQLTEEPTELAGQKVNSLLSGPETIEMYANREAAVFKFDFFDIAVDYGPEGPLAKDGSAKTVKFRIYNRYKVQANLGFHWYTPEGWIVAPARGGYRMSLPSHLGEPLELASTITIPQITVPLVRAAFEITIAGRPTVMLVPLIFVNGNVIP